MSPRMVNPNPDVRYRKKEGRISRDRERYLDSLHHHPMKLSDPHPVRHAWKKRTTPGPWHTPHSHPHEEQLGPHTNQPGPIRFPVKMTVNGRKGQNLR